METSSHPSIPVLSPSFLYHPYIPSLEAFTCYNILRTEYILLATVGATSYFAPHSVPFRLRYSRVPVWRLYTELSVGSVAIKPR